MLAGHVPPSSPNLTVSYYVIDAIVLLLSVLVLLSALRLPHWNREFGQRRRHRVLRVGLRLVWELVLPLVLLLSIPNMFNSWNEFVFTFPDLGPWLLIILSIMIITAITRIVLVVLTLRRKRDESPGVTPTAQSKTPSLT